MARRYTHVSWNVVHLAGSNIFFGGNRSIAMMDISTVGRFDRAFNSFSPLSYPFERILDEGERESFRISREAWIRIKVPISEIQIFSKGTVHRTLIIIIITTIIMDWAFKYLQNWQQCRLANPVGGECVNRWRIWITISDIYETHVTNSRIEKLIGSL